MDHLNQVKQEVVALLLDIKVDGPMYSSNGICDQLTKTLPFPYGIILRVLEPCFYSWPLYSGDQTFPVPHPTKSPENAYLDTKGNLWDKNTEYGRNRWSLLEHCISQLQIQLSKTQVD
jgi:hypothetical protein